MEKFPLLDRDPEILGGKPIIKGTRISISIILEWMATGADAKSIHHRYPQVSEEAVGQALKYASEEMASTKMIDLTLA
ncbi:MAG: DUF433 domain-containing protein [Bacteroidota bacterium]